MPDSGDHAELLACRLCPEHLESQPGDCAHDRKKAQCRRMVVKIVPAGATIAELKKQAAESEQKATKEREPVATRLKESGEIGAEIRLAQKARWAKSIANDQAASARRRNGAARREKVGQGEGGAEEES